MQMESIHQATWKKFMGKVMMSLIMYAGALGKRHVDWMSYYEKR